MGILIKLKTVRVPAAVCQLYKPITRRCASANGIRALATQSAFITLINDIHKFSVIGLHNVNVDGTFGAHGYVILTRTSVRDSTYLCKNFIGLDTCT